MDSLIIIKLIFLITAIHYSFKNIVKAFRGQSISAMEIFLMALSITGFVTIQFRLYE